MATTRFHQLAFRLGRRAAVRGFDVRALMPDRADRAVIFPKLDAALALLEARDPRRFAYLRRDLPRVWVVGLPAAVAECHAAAGMCVLDFDYVADPGTTAGRLAQTLVHEGAHARLARAGVDYRETRRGRVERICVAQEAAFARRVPGAAALVREAEARLDRPAGFFSNAARRERDLDALRDLGWLGALGYRIGRALRRAV